MRRGLFVFLLVVTVFLIAAVHQVYTLLGLLVEDASADAILPSELPPIGESLPPYIPQLIPKIIHQTYINNTIPEKWQPAQKQCLDLHPDYEYKLWTDAMADAFIDREFPWFIDTFRSYPHNIQRADAIRYFVLVRYGGVYIDLDDGCRRSLDPLLTFPAWVRKTTPTGISNDVMASVPNHPFFVHVTESLRSYDRSWILPYITIMSTTGPLFLSVLWKQWMEGHSPPAAVGQGGSIAADWPGRVRVLMPQESNRAPWCFFVEYEGSSWHESDAHFIFWMGRNWLLITAAGFAAAAVLGLVAWWSYTRLLARLIGAGHPADPAKPAKKRRGSPGSGGPGAWLATAVSVLTDRLPGRKRVTDYEMIEQHDA